MTDSPASALLILGIVLNLVSPFLDGPAQEAVVVVATAAVVTGLFLVVIRRLTDHR